MSRLPLILTLLSGLGMGACQGPKQAVSSSQTEASATVANAVRAWEVVLGGRVIGVVVEFAEVGGGRGFHSIRNAHHQELGMVDEHGRTWRYRAHSDEPDWLVTGTVFDGTRAILGVGEEAEVYEVSLETLLREAH